MYALRETFGRKIIECGNPGGLYELWGFEAVTLLDRGYIYDYGEGDTCFRIWGRWEPAEDDGAYKTAIAKAWEAAWLEVGLPPFLGDC